jgi:DNA-binding LacI/PurR family transcriptional regulator
MVSFVAESPADDPIQGVECHVRIPFDEVGAAAVDMLQHLLVGGGPAPARQIAPCLIPGWTAGPPQGE